MTRCIPVTPVQVLPGLEGLASFCPVAQARTKTIPRLSAASVVQHPLQDGEDDARGNGN
jgi:hypothetical protein